MPDLPGISVQPGQLYLARDPMILQTILGSCVGVTFWSERLGAGALCHGVLPRCPRGSVTSEGHRYVDFSIRYLAGQFDALGARRQDVEVKLFGGGSMFPEHHMKPGVADVALRNVEAAHSLVAKHNLNLMAQDLGLTGHRAVNFDIQSGHAWVRHQQLKQG